MSSHYWPLAWYILYCPHLVFQELIYVWNGFALIGKNSKYLDAILKNVEDAMKDIETNKGE
jgi:hypothetical protein